MPLLPRNNHPPVKAILTGIEQAYPVRSPTRRMVDARIERLGWVAKSKWPILPPAHSLEKSAPSFRNASIHRLPLFVGASLLKNSSTPLPSTLQGLKNTAIAVFWPWASPLRALGSRCYRALDACADY